MQRMKKDYPIVRTIYNQPTDSYIDEEIGVCKRLLPGRPKNQSQEHFFCENVGKMFLYHYHNCRYIGTEIPGCNHMDTDFKAYSATRYYGSRKKHIIDVLGMTRKFHCYGVEAKVSISDYNNGFCACMPYTYIICPKDVIPLEMIPPKIGLIYVDIPKFHVVGYGDIRGIEVVKGARKRIDSRWLTNGVFDEDYYNRIVDKWYDYIAYRNTIQSVYNRQQLPIYKNMFNSKATSHKRDNLLDDVLDINGGI